MQMPLETLFQEAKVTMARFMCQQNVKLFPPRISLGSLNTLNQVQCYYYSHFADKQTGALRS